MRASCVFWRTTPWLAPLGFDTNRGGEHVLIALTQNGNVVDAVQQRDDDSLADAFGRRELERRLELGRVRRHPEHVDLSVKCRRRRDVHLEIAEDDTLDAQPARVSRKRLRPEEEQDIRARARERAADETANASHPEYRVSHAHDVKSG